MGSENENNRVKRGLLQDGIPFDAQEFASNASRGLNRLGSNIADNIGKSIGLGPQISRLKGLIFGAEPEGKKGSTIYRDTVDRDLRVKIKIPPAYLGGPAQYLADVGDNAVVFPFTPQIVVQQRATYNALEPVHNNYQFYGYQRSSLDPISIVGTFTAQNELDAKYVLGCIHALRSITKMNFGLSTNAGAPPPVCRLDGYGDYQFNNLPVVISSFFYTLNEDVDYILAGEDTKTRVPTRSEFTIECLPAFSRREIATFSIEEFIQGNETKNKGFI